MWCDNCLLVLPLRHGAIAWAVVIALYSIAGGVFLLMYGQYLFFVYPEWQIYGGIALGVASAAVINILALSNRSYIWTRVCKFIWPFILVISTVRAIIMIVELQRGEDKITWECNNGGQLWTESAADGYDNGKSMPGGFCTSGFSSLYAAFIVSLLVDIGFQMYMLFLNWRFSKRLEHYREMKGPYYGGTGMSSKAVLDTQHGKKCIDLTMATDLGGYPFRSDEVEGEFVSDLDRLAESDGDTI